eukprot:COSAG04_NODE_3590_length_2686_cov_1.315810_4_plen_84_part_01
MVALLLRCLAVAIAAAGGAVAPRVGWVPIARLLFPDTPSLRHAAPVLLNIPDSPFIAALAEARDGSGGHSSVVVRWSQDVGVTW